MKTSRYFPGLNSLRFYAALSVIIAHCAGAFAELRPYGYDRPSLLEWLTLGGYSAVDLFFVLSGFLLTVLLLREREQTGRIAIRRFWTKRALRIWPMYYLFAAIGLVALPLLLGRAYPLQLTSAQVAGVLFLLPSLSNAVGTLYGFAVAWSIGVEEWVYFCLPLILRYVKHPLRLAALIILLRLVTEAIVYRFGDDVLIRVVWDMRFECMVVGALTAALYVYAPNACRLLYKPIVQAYMGLLFLLLIFFDLPSTVLFNLATSVIFAVVILNTATNPRTIFKFETPLLRHLGEISFGIYLIHYPVLYVVMLLIRNTGALYDVWLYTLTIGLTLTLAEVSWRTFEAPFLRRKARLQAAVAA